MDESLKWLLLNADKISVVGLLCLLLLALQRRWLVPGWIYAECVADRKEFRTQVEEAAEATEAKVKLLSDEVDRLRDQLRDHAPRGRMR